MCCEPAQVQTEKATGGSYACGESKFSHGSVLTSRGNSCNVHCLNLLQPLFLSTHSLLTSTACLYLLRLCFGVFGACCIKAGELHASAGTV